MAMGSLRPVALRDEGAHASFDFVAYDPHRIDTLPFGIGKRPIKDGDARDIGTTLTAAHGDEERRVPREFGG